MTLYHQSYCYCSWTDRNRLLNRNCEKIKIDENAIMERNHLIFIDDIKLFAKNEESLMELCEFTKDAFDCIGLKVNHQKSASNIESDKIFGSKIDNKNGYKYLGILDNSHNVALRKNKILLEEKVIRRTIQLCQTKLNAKNLFLAINEYAISTLNYYIGVIPFEPTDYERMDQGIRQILDEHKVTRKTSNIARLYLPRYELGRGLHNIVEKAEVSLIKLNQYLLSKENTKIIIKIEKENVTLLWTINEYLVNKYNINQQESITIEEIKNQQKK